MNNINQNYNTDKNKNRFKNKVNTIRNDTLYVIIPLSNIQNFKRRYELYEEFIHELLKFENIVIYTVECSFGYRDHKYDEINNMFIDNHKYNYIKVNCKTELWHKENLINIGVSRLPHNWKYVAWIDADIEFINKNWVYDTLNELQHYHVVQLFQHAIDLGPKNEIIKTYSSFAYLYNENTNFFNNNINPLDYFTKGHPGYAWACTRYAWDLMGCLLDICILGSADRHMAFAFIGKVVKTIPSNLNQNYHSILKQFQNRITPIIGLLGYVPGTIIHSWHGKKIDRRYQDRWQILIKNNYDPVNDIQKNSYGVIELTNNKNKLKNNIHHYFKMRNEDSVDI